VTIIAYFRQLLNHERKLEEEHTKRQKDSQQKLRQTEQQLEATAAKLESIQVLTLMQPIAWVVHEIVANISACLIVCSLLKATHEADIEEIRQLKVPEQTLRLRCILVRFNVSDYVISET
jgi:hypothetical protein